MSETRHSYQIFPLGDSAVTVELGDNINEDTNREVLARFRALQKDPLPGMIEVTPAYNSFTIYYDVLAALKYAAADKTAYEMILEALEKFMAKPVPGMEVNGRLVEIPVCYGGQYGPDAGRVASGKKLSEGDLFRIHAGKDYKVYMLGFLPGFAYMGTLDERLEIPRKPQPEPIVAGSVGIAGKQTGIYPLNSPGGWQIIGRTPLKLFDKDKEQPVLLQVGDRIRFISITEHEFKNY